MKYSTVWMLAVAALLFFSGVTPARDPQTWIGTWAISPTGLPTLARIRNWTLPVPTHVAGTFRFRLRVSLGGRQIRLRFSNEYGEQPLTLNAVTVGLAAGNGLAAGTGPAGHGLDAVSGSLRKVTFAGSDAITLPGGAPAVSDPIDLPVKALGDLVVSVYVRDGMAAFHCDAGENLEDQAVVEGADNTATEHLAVAKCLYVMRPLVSEVDALVDRPRKVIVALGDSITDGVLDPKTGERGWPGALSRRLQGAGVAVVNAGIGGNRLLQTLPIFGMSALSRLDRDVFAVPGVTHIVLLEGINDIRMAGPAGVFGDVPMVEPHALIAAYAQIVERAHERGIKVIGATLLPFKGEDIYTAERENVRAAVNDWIRTTKKLDGVIDFDAMMRDPADPHKLSSQYDRGDHLHPNPDGYRHMGEAIDLRLFD